MSETRTFDIIVVGGGMFGSACAKYLSQLGDSLNVALIGPQEPHDRADTNVFGCWHDEGRLYNTRDKHGQWGKFTRKSVERFEEIEKESGIQFYNACGYLTVSGPQYKEFEDWSAASERMREQGDAEILDSQELSSVLPFLSVEDDSVGCYQPPGGGGGYLSPRRLVEAQQRIAEKHGCSILHDLVTGVDRNQETGGWVVRVDSGESFACEKLILCQGTYLGLSLVTDKYLPPLDVWYTAQTVALIEVDPDEAGRLSSMPSMVTQTKPFQYTYILPPILYPDGRIYLKFGQHDLTRVLTSPADVVLHYRAGPDPVHVHQLLDEAVQLLPGLQVSSCHGDSCVTLNTPTKTAPYIDQVLPDLVICGAGCGHGAMSSDEIGRVAAVLGLSGLWDSDVDRDHCRVKYKQYQSKL